MWLVIKNNKKFYPPYEDKYKMSFETNEIQ